jgi:hypothetical protein
VDAVTGEEIEASKAGLSVTARILGHKLERFLLTRDRGAADGWFALCGLTSEPAYLVGR